MNLLARYFIKVDKSDSTGGLFKRIIDALSANGNAPQTVRFLLEESGFTKVSSIQRAIKALPQLERFRSTTERSWEKGKVINVLTNLDHRFDTPNREGSFGPVDPAVLLPIAEGIPNPLPFWKAMFLFEGVALLDFRENHSDLLTQRQPWPINNADIPSIFLGSSWGPTRRRIVIVATGLMTPPPVTDSKLPRLPSATISLLESLGRVHRRMLEIVPSAEGKRIEETWAENAAKVFDRFKADAFHEFCRGLREPPANTSAEISGTPLMGWKDAKLPSAKKLIVDAFKQLGFRYTSSESGQGGYVSRKCSKNNGTLEVAFDLSPRTGSICGSFYIDALSWGCVVRFQFPGCRDPESVPIVDEISLYYAIELSRLQTEFIENSLVPEIDRIFGPLPAWWEPGMIRTGK